MITSRGDSEGIFFLNGTVAPKLCSLWGHSDLPFRREPTMRVKWAEAALDLPLDPLLMGLGVVQSWSFLPRASNADFQ